MTKPLKVAIIAGEASGDILGGSLVEAILKRYPDTIFEGIAGPLMLAQGVKGIAPMERLSVMGLVEVLGRLRELLKLRKKLVQHWVQDPPDVFIGIDAPDFNLGLETKLKKQGIRTVHYVSPTIWAWREKRVKKIARAAELVLCLFPFEPKFYRNHGVSATWVGHPMADQLDADNDPAAARERLGLNVESVHIALLPGSRSGELARLAGPMIEAAAILARKNPQTTFSAAMANPAVKKQFEHAMEQMDTPDILLVDRDPHSVIAAADVVMVASGTATLEIMLINRPMVSCYRLAPSTYRLAKMFNLVKTQFFALPNILAGEELVPELLQDETTGPRLASEVLNWLDDHDRRQSLHSRFSELHEGLRCDASNRAADAVAKLLALR